MNSYRKSVIELQKMDDEYGDVWKLPPYKDCLAFVMTEIGETFDALMRMKPEYFRNRDFNQSQTDFYNESCDVVMMCIKALMSIKFPFNFSFFGLEAQPSIKNAVLVISDVVGEDLTTDDNPVYSMTIENALITLIMTIEKEAGEGYVGNRIEEKMNKTRTKIEERKAQNNA